MPFPRQPRRDMVEDMQQVIPDVLQRHRVDGVDLHIQARRVALHRHPGQRYGDGHGGRGFLDLKVRFAGMGGDMRDEVVGEGSAEGGACV